MAPRARKGSVRLLVHGGELVTEPREGGVGVDAGVPEQVDVEGGEGEGERDDLDRELADEAVEEARTGGKEEIGFGDDVGAEEEARDHEADAARVALVGE